MPDTFSRYEIYTSVGSIYCYKDTGVLKNRFNIRDNDLLKKIESDYYSVRQAKLLQNPISGNMTPSHLCRIHKYFFGKLYAFAGHYRREDIMKGKTRFLPYSHIPDKLSACLLQLRNETFLTELTLEDYLKRAAYYLAELNYIHPFREGNGRATREFMRYLFMKSGYGVNWSLVEKDDLLDAMELSVYEPDALIPLLSQCIYSLPQENIEQK